jgi:hypothetical protein
VSYMEKGKDHCPEPRKEPIEMERVVNRPYEKPKPVTKGIKELSKEIGKITGEK